MKLKAFRIRNFRSIVDSGWSPFSPDGVTVLVGQNESGKTSVLQALATTLSGESITDDDLRSGEPLPVIDLKVECQIDEIVQNLEESRRENVELIGVFLLQHHGLINLQYSWVRNEPGSEHTYGCDISIDEPELIELLDEARVIAMNAAPVTTDVEAGASGPVAPTAPVVSDRATPTSGDIGTALHNAGPTMTMFSETLGLLPNEIAVEDNGTLASIRGTRAARNYLTAAGINLKELLAADRRTRENMLTRANKRVTEDFNSFWSQNIGGETKLSLWCEIERYGAGANAGKPHLVFWINDGSTRLYPNQRSQGVRWFVSFFLQLRAATFKSKGQSFFLLDEPGANLHSKAQADVLKLINALREQIPIVYSTHSPHLVEYNKLYRIHAVQRSDAGDDSPTVLLDAHRLGAASSDTLSPILTAMGSDLASQQVIRRSHNVILEEVSGFYYLSAFWKLFDVQAEAYFVAATGVNKIPVLANMFLAWGLKFITVVDDDPQGRSVFKDLKRDLYGDDDDVASRHLHKIRGCEGVEDLFSTDDFKQFVLSDVGAEVVGKNTAYLRTANRSKPVLAYQFKLAVEAGSVNRDDLQEATRQRISALVQEIAERLTTH